MILLEYVFVFEVTLISNVIEWLCQLVKDRGLVSTLILR
jgi:hypothetical protein